MKDNNKKIILYYVVSEQHIVNCVNIMNLQPDYNFLIIYDKFINKKVLNKYNVNFIKLDQKVFEFIEKNKLKIKIAILSTTQIRVDPLLLIYNLMINKINTLAIQETHQFYLHNMEMNNYIIPTHNIFVCSKYEKTQFIKLGYNDNNIHIVGWNFKNSDYEYIKAINSSKKNILLLLNASSKINNVSIENTELQIKIINKIYKIFSASFNIIVKVHPTEDITNIRKLKKNTNKNLKIYKDEHSSKSLINQSDYIFCTGYSQSIFETIVMDKKMILIPIEFNMKILKDLHSFELDKLNNFEIKKFNSINYEKIVKFNDLDLIDHYDEIFKKNFDKILKQEFFILDNLIELSLWLYYFKDYHKSKKIFNILRKNKKYDENLNSLYSYLFENFTLNNNEINLIFNKLRNNAFFIFKYIFINKISVYESITNETFNYLIREEPKYLAGIFFIDFHNFLYYLLIKNSKNYYNQILKSHINNNKKLYNSKSKVFKFYLKLRYFMFYLNIIPFFSSLNYKVFNIFFKN
tara:strand:+ start:4304 stop:5866 length:1563 start_codon:yes stop_codon:yes gene_type:complete